MVFEERAYKTLVVSSSEKFNDNLSPVLGNGKCNPITWVDSIAAAKRMILENVFDYVIINTPLPDELGVKFAIDLSENKNLVCLILVRSELYPEIKAKVTPYGAYTLSKPTSGVAISQALDFCAATRERLRGFEKKTLSIEGKMEEIRLVNRAKWLLIENMRLTEPEAHKYIEKKAMNLCISKTDVAREIIKNYP
ncbi:MAG: ANTAR domain-containing protein [Lachnospiraceae bacterium]|nr:ANTAR domain-containing protein [Lachnospiraceae bacterium]